MQQHIYINNLNGKQALCFDTGLEPRSFARTKMSQCFTEPGFIVNPDGTNSVWKASGVFEANGLMTVWGTAFMGERLDLIIADAADKKTTEARQAALQAVVFWIRAKLLLSDEQSALAPGAAFIFNSDKTVSGQQNGSVFFAPENLSHRCLLAEGAEQNSYNCPDLFGMDAAAFCAGSMLYKILTQTPPYRTPATVFQDMREGVFLPPHLAAPGLYNKLCSLIQDALLLPASAKNTSKSGTDILNDFLKLLMRKETGTISITSLFHPLSAEENSKNEKEKKHFLKRKMAVVKMKRFAVRNKYPLIGSLIALFFIGFIVTTTILSQTGKPTTKGMNSIDVVRTYYESFSTLNHVFMEACIDGADRSDIDIATNLYVVNKVKQANDLKSGTTLISARVWKEAGGQLPAPDVFGVVTDDILIEYLDGSETEGRILYRANYTLWYPNDTPASRRSDDLLLNRNKKGNWVITSIKRTIL
jgi:hypothetical protein